MYKAAASPVSKSLIPVALIMCLRPFEFPHQNRSKEDGFDLLPATSQPLPLH